MIKVEIKKSVFPRVLTALKFFFSKEFCFGQRYSLIPLMSQIPHRKKCSWSFAISIRVLKNV